MCSAPVPLSLALSTAYQASTPSRPVVITINLWSQSSFTLAGNAPKEGGIWVGDSAGVASGIGAKLGEYSNVLSGVAVVGLTVLATQSQNYSFLLPAGWYYAVRQTVGTGLTIVSAFEQAVR